MTKCIIYRDDKSSADLFFCKDGKIFIKNNDSYEDLSDLVKKFEGKAISRFLNKTFKQKIEHMKKLLTMDWIDASRYHLEHQKLNLRKGKLFEGEFNGK